MTQYWPEFLALALAHLLAVASPGPDFAIVLKQSLRHGRRTAIWTSLGIGSGITLHIAYSLLGLGLILRASPVWFQAAKFAGVAYLVWLGIQGLRSSARPANRPDQEVVPAPSARQAFVTGFLTNALNPKATLFFLSLYLMLVSPQTPHWIQAIYGAWMVATTMGWFCLVSLVFTRPAVRDRFLLHGHWIERVLGVVFLAFALRLSLATLG